MVIICNVCISRRVFSLSLSCLSPLAAGLTGAAMAHLRHFAHCFWHETCVDSKQLNEITLIELFE